MGKVLAFPGGPAKEDIPELWQKYPAFLKKAKPVWGSLLLSDEEHLEIYLHLFGPAGMDRVHATGCLLKTGALTLRQAQDMIDTLITLTEE